MSYTERIKAPGAAFVNGLWVSPHTQRSYSRLHGAKNATWLALLGIPSAQKTDECTPPTPALRARMVTKSVGPFRVTGLDPAVRALTRIMARVKELHPNLYPLLGTAGMLCCRKVRGGTSWSNHSWGTAIDFLVGRAPDSMGDGFCLRGLLAMYGVFHSEGWYWGTAFSREDSMHYEVSDELAWEWAEIGLFGPNAQRLAKARL